LINFCSPRAFSIGDGIASLPELQWVAVGLAAWAYVGWSLRSDPRIQFCNLLVAIGLPVFFLQRCGSGVDTNAQFDLVIGVSISVGMAFLLADQLPLARRFNPDRMRIVLLLAICARLAASTSLEPVRWFADPTFRTAINDSEEEMANSVAQVRAIPGDVYCDPMVTYRAGKPFAVDEFNTLERIDAGRLPGNAVDKRLDDGSLTFVDNPPNYVVP